MRSRPTSTTSESRSTLYETQGDATRTLELAVGLFPLWEIRDRIVEGDHWPETALALPGGERTTLRAMAFGARCSLGYHLSRDGRELLALAREGVEIMREAGSPADLAQALTALAGTAAHRPLSGSPAGRGGARRRARLARPTYAVRHTTSASSCGTPAPSTAPWHS